MASERCLAPEAEATAEVPVAGRTLRRDGIVVRDPRRAPGGAVIAVLGGPGGGDVHDVRLMRIGARIAGAGAGVVAVLGGMAGDGGDLAAWAGAVLPTGVPVLLVPADTEPPAEFHANVRTLRRLRPEVFDGTAVRAFLAPDVELVTLPGSPWPARPPGTGCPLDEADALALAGSLPPAAAPRFVVSATAPRQAGVAATDRGALGAHVGSDVVARAVEALGARGVFSLLPRESSGTLAALGDGAVLDHSVAAVGTRFALAVGRAGSDPVETLAGELVGPVAWIVRVESNGATRVERIEP